MLTANDVLTSTNILEADRAKYAPVMAKFEEFFKVRMNFIFERARFNQRNQLKEETAEKYIATLYSLVENCNYGDLKEEILRDRLVVGIQDQKLSRQLQLDAVLTLEKVKKATPERSCDRASQGA